jgi:hypothetical protein
MLKTDADPVYRSVMTGVLVLDGEPGWDRVVSVFETATRKAPRLRQKAVAPLLPVGPPQWVSDAGFDLGYHVRRAAAPGDGSLLQVLQAASAAATAPFDRARPLWDATVFEGMPGGSAVVLRAHHALADGMGALEILGALLDLEPAPSREDPPLSAEPSAPATSPAGLLLSRLAAAPMPGSALRRNLSLTLAAAPTHIRTASGGNSAVYSPLSPLAVPLLLLSGPEWRYPCPLSTRRKADRTLPARCRGRWS